jgi:hypothetical protein
LQSQDFATTWSANNVSVSTNSTSAPDGTTTADTLNDGAVAAASHSLIQTPGISASTTYAISVFAKNVDRRYVGIAISTTSSNNYGTVEFDLDGSGAVSRSSAVGTGFSVVSSSITSVGNSWFRCVAIITTGSASVTDGRATIYLSDGAGAFDSRGRATYSGTNASIYAWGAQLEQRSSVTSYTATTTAPITNYIPVLQTAAADVPRFDHNPTTRAALGLLVEEQRANIVTYSDDFANAAWTKFQSSITSNTVVAPSGTLTGDALIEDTATAEHRISQTASATLNSSITASLYVKAQSTGAGRSIRLLIANNGSLSNNVSCVFVNTAGVFAAAAGINSGTASGATGSVISVGNGWYRLILTGIPDSGVGSGTAALRINLHTGATASYAGDGYSGVFIWGAQLEAGAFPTSYIATTTASVTRNADVASMTGANFSGWYNSSQGTLFSNSLPPDAAAFFAFQIISDGTNANELQQRTVSGGTNPTFVVNTLSSTVASIGVVLAKGVENKIASAYKVDDFQSAVNGTLGTADNSGAVPTVTQLDLGRRANGTTYLNGYIRTIRYYPVRNSDAQLQALTG